MSFPDIVPDLKTRMPELRGRLLANQSLAELYKSQRDKKTHYVEPTTKQTWGRAQIYVDAPMSDVRAPKPIAPMPSLLTSPMIEASSSARRGSLFTSSSVRK